MSISGSLSNAYSGLTAASRAAQNVSANVANALTPGYGRREVSLSSTALDGNGGGVRIDGIRRIVDQLAISNRRLADAAEQRESLAAKGAARLEAALGEPGTTGSLSDLVTGLETALLAAANAPDSQSQLHSTLNALQALSGKINTVTQETQNLRMDADTKIAAGVENLNATLQNLHKLNVDIARQVASGHEPTALFDQRQRLIDGITDLVPLKIVPREFGKVALISTGGTVLLDGRAGVFSFTESGVITPDMSLASGALSGLSLDGVAVPIGQSGGPLNGGALAAQFQLRDVTAPEISLALDIIARDLIERFDGPAPDTTIGALVPGLFTDAGLAFDPLKLTGLAGRLAVNSAVDPDLGGALWRLRDGIGASSPGPQGDGRLLANLAEVMQTGRAAPGGPFATGLHTPADLATDLASLTATSRLHAEERFAYESARRATFSEAELAAGVNTDAELQNLLLIEENFAANARVISAADELLQVLLGI